MEDNFTGGYWMQEPDLNFPPALLTAANKSFLGVGSSSSGSALSVPCSWIHLVFHEIQLSWDIIFHLFFPDRPLVGLSLCRKNTICTRCVSFVPIHQFPLFLFDNFIVRSLKSLHTSSSLNQFKRLFSRYISKYINNTLKSCVWKEDASPLFTKITLNILILIAMKKSPKFVLIQC